MDDFYIPPYSVPPPSMIPPAPSRTPPPSSNAPLNPSTATFHAILQNNVGLVKSIMNQTQFNPNILRNKDGKTPLMVAALENCPDVVKYLVELQSVNIDLQDNDGESALYQAASAGNVEVVDILINANANVESCNKENITPLIIAAYHGHTDVCRVLIDHGYASVNFQDNSFKTALSLSSYQGHVNVVKVLLARGANVHLTDQYGWTALMLAAYAGHAEMCQLLLEYNSDKSVTTDNGKTAVILARNAGHSDVASLIENYGSDSNDDDFDNNINNKSNSSFKVNNTDNNFNIKVISNSFGINDNIMSNDINNYNNNDRNGYKNNDRNSYKNNNNNSYNNHDRNSSNNYNNNNNNRNSINNYNNNNRNSINNHNNNDRNSTNNYSNNVLSSTNNYSNNDLGDSTKNYSNNDRNNINNNNNNNSYNYYNKPTPPPPHRSSRTPGRFPIAMAQQPIETNPTNQNIYPKIPVIIDENSTRGYLTPLSRSDSRRTKLQHKNPEHFNSQYFNNKNTGTKNVQIKTTPHLKNDMAPRENKTPWVLFSLAITACFCNPCLSSIGNMRDPNVRQAWREKLALVFIIVSISLFMGFLAFGFATIACGIKKQEFYKEDVYEKFGPNQPLQKMHVIRGKIYNTGEYILFGSHRPLSPPITDNDLVPIINPTFGQDISEYFPLDNKALNCPFSPNNTICTSNNKLFHCHTSSDSLRKLKELYVKQRVVYSWENITKPDSTLFVYNNLVYDLEKYLNLSNNDRWLGDDDVTEWLKGLLGKDSTLDIVRTERGRVIAKCLPNFEVGEIIGTTIGCFANDLIIIIMTVVFTGISIIKFISAIAFDWFLSWQLGKLSDKPKTDEKMSRILLLVTCYSEGESSMRTTLDSF